MPANDYRLVYKIRASHVPTPPLSSLYPRILRAFVNFRVFFFFLMIGPPPISPLFPSTPLSGSGLAVRAVGEDHVFAAPHRRERPARDASRPDVEMADPADLAEGVGLGGFFFEPADQEHLTQ